MMKRTNSNTSANLTYLLIGGGIGATLALLFAPKSGSEFRDDISIATNNGLKKTKETVSKLRENTNSYYEVAKDKVNNIYNTVANKAEKLADTVQELPRKAEELLHTKIKQIDDAVESGQKEVKKTLKANNS